MTAAMRKALLESETRQAKLLFELGWRVEDPSTYILDDVTTPRNRSTKLHARYYQELHDDNDAYQANNWLVAERASILECRPNTITEVGCGNGAFSLAASEDVGKVFAVDWPLSPWNVTRVLENCAGAAPLQYHVIACYDDGHSHLTVMRPSAWLATFWRFFPDARLKRTVDETSTRSSYV